MRSHIDAETRVIMNGMQYLYSAQEQADAERYAKERIRAHEAGVAKTPMWVNPYLRLKTGDNKLQIRWDFEQDTWILERWIDNQQDSGDGYWLQVTVLANAFNQTPKLNHEYMKNLVEHLKAHDLQRQDPQEYIRQKRNLAHRKREDNRKEGEKQLAAAIDAMSMRQVQNFIDVHRAMHTGETIVAHGADEKSLAHMTQASQQAMATEEGLVRAADTVPINKAFNQGMHPLQFRRKKKSE